MEQSSACSITCIYSDKGLRILEKQDDPGKMIHILLATDAS
jgi:hypothetical protein